MIDTFIDQGSGMLKDFARKKSIQIFSWKMERSRHQNRFIFATNFLFLQMQPSLLSLMVTEEGKRSKLFRKTFMRS